MTSQFFLANLIVLFVVTHVPVVDAAARCGMIWTFVGIDPGSTILAEDAAATLPAKSDGDDVTLFKKPSKSDGMVSDAGTEDDIVLSHAYILYDSTFERMAINTFIARDSLELQACPSQ